MGDSTDAHHVSLSIWTAVVVCSMCWSKIGRYSQIVERCLGMDTGGGYTRGYRLTGGTGEGTVLDFAHPWHNRDPTRQNRGYSFIDHVSVSELRIVYNTLGLLFEISW
jgi:hypothetical protein